MMGAQERKAFAASIKPQVKNESDKFSWRLYKRALKNGREKVYLMAWESIHGYRKPDIEILKSGFVPASILAIGFKDGQWFHGASLRQVCTPGDPNHDWAYAPGHYVAEWIDVTDWFWREYARVGRCLLWAYVHDWMQINKNSRKCASCGKVERRSIKTVKEIKRKEVWI